MNPLKSGLMNSPKYRGLVGTTLTVVKEEGVTALYKGLVAGVHR
jgi:solute carrier family 25 uncoupling protein 8/9